MRARRFKFECGSNTSCKLLYSGSPGQINRQGLRMATQDAAAAQLLTGRSRLRECTSRLWESLGSESCRSVGRGERAQEDPVAAPRRPRCDQESSNGQNRDPRRRRNARGQRGRSDSRRGDAADRGHTPHGSPWRTRAYERDSGNTHLMPHGLDRVQHGVQAPVRLPHD